MKIENLITILEHYRQSGAKTLNVSDDYNLFKIQDFNFNKESGNLYLYIKPQSESHCIITHED